MLSEVSLFFERLREWYQEDDNRLVMWWTIGISATVTLLGCGVIFLGASAVVKIASDTRTVTIANGNPCLTIKGLVRSSAPPSCYDDKLPREVISRADETPYNLANKVAKDSASGYNPPCVKDGLPGCSDRVYGKRLMEGLVGTVTFNSDEKQVSDGHLQPDYTEVKFDSEYTDQEPPNSEKFCGNVLNRFTPGKKVRMVINESKLADYNGCYTVDVVVLTFGNSPYVTGRVRR